MEWKTIDEFPDYSVSDTGLIRNDETGRVITLTRNQQGLIQVGMMKEGLQHKRGVTLLVARAFLESPTLEAFNTPINLDGDRSNNIVSNLMWRPRWFAIKYHKQFETSRSKFARPIFEIKTGEQFKNSRAAAVKYGLLDFDIFMATMNRTYVWPTYQQFRTIEE